MAMASGPVKRPSSTLDFHNSKRPKNYYHHHHRLQEPVTLPPFTEPAVQDDANIDHMMNRSIGQALRHEGFEMADPAALSSLRSSAEEYLFKISTYVRQSMMASRRIQPIPHDIEHALIRCRVSLDDLLPSLKSTRPVAPTPILPPSPPPEDEVTRKLPFLNALKGAEGLTNRSYVPKHFPDFPSKHTYSTTAVFTERESDPRQIRERAAEDGRHGEEALRKLASAAFRDNPTSASGKDKKLWGRRMESMETMFEKTVKGLAKRLPKNPLASASEPMGFGLSSSMDLDLGPADGYGKARSKISWNIEMGPIVNCERDLWRRTTASGQGEEKTSKPSTSIELTDGGGF
ncbi:uncharacterized protein N7477_007183 [Penicillium maclennaniae]|uniref:uncharacterized protein n=1 Tax=Penicillium maclennaniae TaxID=1343394 RepID=UPI0025404D98|nr:uncharacterized protein N7477_007183 [Penicillium maclennaniae]KAJ5668613.1 hypothetical protein N7477_007183 [Penicillium maclennaniae]